MPRSWSLRTRLLITQVALLAFVCVSIGVATEFALQRFLMHQLDSQLLAAARRSVVMWERPPPMHLPPPPGMPMRFPFDPEQGPGPGFLNAPGQAARMVGASNLRIMRRHILPHLVGPVIVYGTLAVAAAISFEAALSFLGFGLPADVPSWGRMISDAVPGGRYNLAPWMMIVPGTLLFLTVLAFNLLGDGLRDALDPRGGGDR